MTVLDVNCDKELCSGNELMSKIKPFGRYPKHTSSQFIQFNLFELVKVLVIADIRQFYLYEELIQIPSH